MGTGYDNLPSGSFAIAMQKTGGAWQFDWAGSTWRIEDLPDRKPSCSDFHETPGERRKREAKALADQQREEARQRLIQQEEDKRERERRAVADAVSRSRQPQTDLEKKTQADGFWTDSRTGLTWSTDSGRTFSYYDAKKFCSSTRLLTSDWRLPTTSELNRLYAPAQRHDFVESDFLDRLSTTQYHIAGGLVLSWPSVWSEFNEVFSFRTGEAFAVSSKPPDYPVLCVRGPGRVP